MPPQVTVAVPVKDRRERMLRCLEAIVSLDHPDFEVIVADNESRDGTAEACRKFARDQSLDIRVEVIPGTLGRVRNRAADLARGRYIAFTDSDCSPTRGWLTAATEILDADPTLGLVTGPTLPPVPPVRSWARFVEVPAFSWRFESCNIVFRAEALRTSPGFDEVVGDGWEDTAAGFGVLRAGWRAGFAPDALIHHDVTYPGFWAYVRREQRTRNLARVVKRYPEIRRRLLYARVFPDRRSAGFAAALAGLSLGHRIPAARLAALPYAAYLLRRGKPHLMAQWAVYDASLHVAALRGALAHRAFVL